MLQCLMTVAACRREISLFLLRSCSTAVKAQKQFSMIHTVIFFVNSLRETSNFMNDL